MSVKTIIHLVGSSSGFLPQQPSQRKNARRDGLRRRSLHSVRRYQRAHNLMKHPSAGVSLRPFFQGSSCVCGFRSRRRESIPEEATGFLLKRSPERPGKTEGGGEKNCCCFVQFQRQQNNNAGETFMTTTEKRGEDQGRLLGDEGTSR